MARPTVSVGLYLDRASDPISGSLVYPDGRRLAFDGWIELTAALEDARHFEALDVVAHGKQSSGPRAVSEPSGDTEEGEAKPDSQRKDEPEQPSDPRQ